MGYDYTSASLTRIADTLRSSAQHLGDTAKSAPPSPDAGSSSGLVAEVLKNLLASGAAAAASFDDMAGKVHASQGSYDRTENDNAGEFNRDLDAGAEARRTGGPK